MQIDENGFSEKKNVTMQKMSEKLINLVKKSYNTEKTGKKYNLFFLLINITISNNDIRT